MKKLYLIEILRFIASFSVIIYHYEIYFFRFNNLNPLKISDENIEYLPFGTILDFVYKHGDYGVHLFWTISGFVISYIYLDKIKKYNWKIFFVNRFSRLYPLHFATLITIVIIQLINSNFSIRLNFFDYNDFYHFFLNFFFISAWGLEQKYSFNTPIWSVSLEIIAYILFFILASKFKNPNLIKLFSFYLLLMLASKIGFMKDDAHNDLVSCLRLFITGVIIYKLFTLNKKYFFLLISILLLIFAFINNFKIFIFCPGLLMLILSIENFFPLKNKMLQIVCSVIGNLTYSSYLIHFPVSLIFISYFRNETKIFSSEYFFVIYIILIIIISFISYNFVEKKTKKYLRSKLSRSPNRHY